MTTVLGDAHELAIAVANKLTYPAAAELPTGESWWAQSLARGVPGVALLHIELAAAALTPWRRAHDWLTYATTAPITGGMSSHLYYGLPAIAHAVACAADRLPGSYSTTLQVLDREISRDTVRRVQVATDRMSAKELPTLSEFDVIRGLSGVGAYLLRWNPDSLALQSVLSYLVRLTEPVIVDGDTLPGWWTLTGPSGRPDAAFPGGHGNNGMAHGIGGPLALLALAALRGITVNGHTEAITRVLAWLDHWSTNTGTGAAWPYYITRPELHADQVTQPSRPVRPSWCYGTAGLARAQQLAALATGDHQRRHLVEDALVGALTDSAQTSAATDLSLCHGHAGFAHVALRAAADATHDNGVRLREAALQLLGTVHPPGTFPVVTATRLLNASGPALLEGSAGIALTAASAATAAGPATWWDACLLIA
ncbi:lanthionine synthetase C family protein [Microbispora sp. NBRC 16548]|uniref:lanthionine synthetase C family protein n=1 Tax=Microbispora sp. NBRC 16548 TaxID=3030994 RepID=UPI0025552B13|nr:lanthionine synthetase C family protein [Microbispora sp. NBRC 16548]